MVNKIPSSPISSPSNRPLSPTSVIPSPSPQTHLFPEISPFTSHPATQFTSKPTSLEDSLAQELDQLLYAQAQHIENQFKELLKEPDQELIETLIEIETWGYEIFSFTNDKVLEGANFLKHLFPSLPLYQLWSAPNQKEWNALSTLMTHFLACLDAGVQGAALIYKMKILEQSKQFLVEFKNRFETTANSQPMDPSVATKIPGNPPIDIQKIIHEWEVHISLAEKELTEEKVQYFFSASSNLLTLLSEPLIYLPHSLLTRFPLIKALGWLSFGIEFTGLALELKEIRKENADLSEWKNIYQRWKAKIIPTFKMKKGRLQRIHFKPKHPRSLSVEQHREALFTALETRSIASIHRRLKERGIELPDDVTTREEIKNYLETHPDCIQAFTHFQQKLHAFNNIIHTTQDLLTKREAIFDKKMHMLKQRFPSIRDRIQERKKQTFLNDMEFLKKALQNSTCSLEVIENLLNKWDCLNHQNLMSAFRSFKDNPSDASQQHLLQILTEWTDNPIIDQHFDNWFESQDKDLLIKDFIDHQETIEHTIKNSLRQMVEKKNELESRFLQFKSNTTHLHFGLVTFSFATSITLAVLGLVSLPLGGIGVIFLGLSLGSTLFSLALLAAGYLHSLYYKPHTTDLMTIPFRMKLVWVSLRHAITNYSHQSKEKKLIEVAKILHQLHSLSASSNQDKTKSKTYQIALENYKKAKRDCEESELKVKHWTQRLKEIESRITDTEWKDFSQYSSLSTPSFEPLDAFQQAFQACDFRFLNSETRDLLEVHLGINLEHLQNEIKKDPEAIKKSLHEFFGLTNAKFIDFIRHQQERLNKKLLKKLS